HSFATEMYHQKVPLDAIQAMMGHDKIEQTAVYIKVENKVQKKALGQLTINGSLPWE
ncbi:MAG: tyrosine-type recombinase/integrase, partial [Candidatus Omnitrophica bacterium]|nr:tyrosine-type recombinase/integrase [Candidatus Omnitrophota bacterium]